MSFGAIGLFISVRTIYFLLSIHLYLSIYLSIIHPSTYCLSSISLQSYEYLFYALDYSLILCCLFYHSICFRFGLWEPEVFDSSFIIPGLVKTHQLPVVKPVQLCLSQKVKIYYTNIEASPRTFELDYGWVSIGLKLIFGR